jgi:hypothetical protein
MPKEPIYSKRVIEVADYVFANPMAKRKNVLAKFGKKWQTSPRTIDRIWKEAQQYNEIRLKEQEDARRMEMVNAAKEQVKKEIADREEILISFTAILRGKPVKRPKMIDDKGNILGYEISYPSYRDIIAAGSSISQMEGYLAPTKQELTGKDGAPIVPNHEHVVIFKDFSKAK